MSYNLLTVKEEIKNNLSSQQIAAMLDMLLHAAAAPLFERSFLMRELILQTLLQTQDDHRRKVSIHNKDITASLVVHAVLNKDFSPLAICGIDRSMIFSSINLVHNKLKKIVDLEIMATQKSKRRRHYINKMLKSCKEIGVQVDEALPLFNWVNNHLKMYRLLKEYISAKYYKFAWREACAANMITGLHVDINELSKNYNMAVEKAIDKYDSDKGTLTSYIQQWLKAAKTNPDFPHQYCESYSMPSSIRKDKERSGIALTNMSQTIEEKHHEIDDPDALNKMQAIHKDNMLLNCLRKIRNIDIVYRVLDLPVNLQSRELQKLQGLV